MVKAAFALNRTKTMKAHLLLCAISIASLVSAPAKASENPERAMCQARWPDDFAMQVFCINKQLKAASMLSPIIKSPSKIQKKILDMCADRWRNDFGGFDWDMVNFCYEKQMTAYEQLN